MCSNYNKLVAEGAEARVASDGGGNNDNKNTEVLNKG